MKDQDKFLDWYQKRFNSIVEQPPNEVWNNISKELDINEVWTKVDSRLSHIDRRKTLVKGSVYAGLLLLLLFGYGSIIFRTLNKEPKQLVTSNSAVLGTHRDVLDTTQSVSTRTNKPQNLFSNDSLKHEIILTDKKGNHFSSESTSKSDNETNKQAKEFKQPANNQGKESISKFFSENSSAASLVHSTKNLSAKKQEKNSTEPEDSNESSPTINFDVIASHQTSPQELLVFPIPTLLVSNTRGDSIMPDSPEFALAHDSYFYSQSPSGYNPFQGFYSGATIIINNTWLLNHFTFDGLKAKSLTQTNIDFGYAYGISVGYNFNGHFSGELNWYINSKEGQTYNFYNDGKYVTQKIRMDLAVTNLTIKHRNQGFNSFLNTPSSKNLLLGMNLGIFKKDRSSLTSKNNDIDIKMDITPKFDEVRYSLAIGYEYEILAFHKFILSSSLLGNIGFSSIYKNDTPIQEGFNHTYSGSIGINFSAKYLIK